MNPDLTDCFTCRGLCVCVCVCVCVIPAEFVAESLMSCPQVGVVGETEDWVMVHQVSNEPEARSLEVPGLNPYTYYR